MMNGLSSISGPFIVAELKGFSDMRRSEIREHVFKLLFRVEFHDAAELAEQDKLYFEPLEADTGAQEAYKRQNQAYRG